MSDNCKEGHEIKCSNCGYTINDKSILRCPRCFNLLIKPGCNGNCSNCKTHNN